MRDDERRRAMLAEMGIRLWPARDPAPTMSSDAAASPGAAPVVLERTEARVADRLSEGVAARVPDAPARAAATDAHCARCDRRSRAVPGTGPDGAHWMLVGDAPGELEELEGEPFAGKAGALLDRMLHAVGLQRGASDDPARQVFTTNAMKCRPPLDRNPLPEELAGCEPALAQQVARVRPRVIVAMGRFAAQALLQSDAPIGRLRGTVHRYHGVPVVATFHPSYLLRNPADKARAWDDLCLALEAAAPSREGVERR